MGKRLARDFRSARLVFDEVEEALQLRLTRIMFGDHSEELRSTKNAQPAILAHSIAALRAAEEVWEFDAARATCMAGHSVGEFAALAASGALSLWDAAKLVRARGEAMERAQLDSGVPGAMLALLSPDPDAARALCEQAERATGGRCVLAGLNSPAQVVLSGSATAIEYAAARAKDAGAARKAVPLAVSAAFHSPYMLQAAHAVAGKLDVCYDEVAVAFAAHCGVQPQEAGNRLPSLLSAAALAASGVCAGTAMKAPQTPVATNAAACATVLPVQWTGVVGACAELGASEFLECGPKAVLSGLVKQIRGKSNVVTRATDEDGRLTCTA